jgi:ABC-type ATPase with predicted acetyltransferase domain
MKDIIAVRGTKNVGKTTTIKMALQLFLKKYQSHYRPEDVHYIKNSADIVVAITITIDKDGVSVIVIVIFASAGDTAEILQKLLTEYIGHLDWSILVCATKKWGKTVEIIENYRPKKSLHWVEKEPAAEGKQKSDNTKKSYEILDHIDFYLKH